MSNADLRVLVTRLQACNYDEFLKRAEASLGRALTPGERFRARYWFF